MAKKKLSVKQTKFVKEYIKNYGNGTQAALKAYDTNDENTAHAIASENLRKPTIQEAIEKAMVKHEITMDAAVKPIADGLQATRTIGFGDDAIESVDHSTRLKASGMALKLLGADKGEGGNTIIFNKGDIVREKYVKD